MRIFLQIVFAIFFINSFSKNQIEVGKTLLDSKNDFAVMS